MDLRRNPPSLSPLTIIDSTVTAVETFKFLGSIISLNLNWDPHINSYRCPPANPPRTVYIQSEEKSSENRSENHSGSLTSKSSPFRTFAIWPALQSHNYQDSQAQEQFLPPGNPTYEQLNAPLPPLCNNNVQ